jgi:pimeloyl-ACP methyl ester carboxylesterase
MAESLDPASDSPPHVVILVHGIRTRGQWYIAVRDELTRAGFAVELTNYGRFDLIRFLAPIPWFRAMAVAHVERDIRAAMVTHDVRSVSVIAHSFGTFITAWILRKKFDITFRQIIFCGSVVKFSFPFEQHTRFRDAVVNEVGTRDVWPILAESVTWGYGSTGAFGFSRPRVFDRYHRGVSHSAFLNAEFCRRWWIPVLQGSKPQTHDQPEPPPWWLRLLSVIPLKYVIVVALAAALFAMVCSAPLKAIPASDSPFFVGDFVGALVNDASQPHSSWCPELVTRRRHMRTTGVEGAAESLVACQASDELVYRDPVSALQLLADRIPCLEVAGVAKRDLRVRMKKTLAKEIKTNAGRSLWLCGCDDAQAEDVVRIANR